MIFSLHPPIGEQSDGKHRPGRTLFCFVMCLCHLICRIIVMFVATLVFALASLAVEFCFRMQILVMHNLKSHFINLTPQALAKAKWD